MLCLPILPNDSYPSFCVFFVHYFMAGGHVFVSPPPEKTWVYASILSAVQTSFSPSLSGGKSPVEIQASLAIKSQLTARKSESINKNCILCCMELCQNLKETRKMTSLTETFRSCSLLPDGKEFIDSSSST